MTGPWAVVATEEFEEWMMSLTDKQRNDTDDAIDQLRQDDDLFEEHIRKLGEK